MLVKIKYKGESDMNSKTVAIIGGCGHVGLPLGVKIAFAGLRTILIDKNEKAVKTVNSGKFPFLEKGGEQQLSHALRLGLEATSDPKECSHADVVVFVTGTPIDEHLNPIISDVFDIFDSYTKYIKPSSLVIMRSTLFPGTMEHLYLRIKQQGLNLHLAFCPERVAQGYALDEMDSLPQIVSAFDSASFNAAYEVFAKISPEIIKLTPTEAEMAKLMANSWRYLEFAIANQFYLIAEKSGVDFYKIFKAIKHNYRRANTYKSPGFSAGPCLFKDTMQLASYYDNQFYIGHAAMLINEGLASFAIDKAEEKVGGHLWGKTLAILGLAFKADNDDTRDSLSFKLRKYAEFRGAKVLLHDPYISPGKLEDIIAKSDIVILATPHKEYTNFKCPKPFIDVWGVWQQTELEILPGKDKQF